MKSHLDALAAAVISLVLVPSLPGMCLSGTWRVPGECPTIRAGLDSAGYGDTVLVAPGTYYSGPAGTEDQYWIRMKDGVTLMSQEGAEVTTLVKCPSSAGGTNYTVYLDDTWNTTVKGFTLREWELGECEPGGGVWSTAVSCDEAHATIEDNVITGQYLNGIRARGPFPVSGSPVIKNNVITECVDRAIECANSGVDCSPRIEGNRIVDNCIGLHMENALACVEGNIISYKEMGILVKCPALVNFAENVITYNTDYGAWIWQSIDHWYSAPCFNCTWQRETANDIYGNGSYDIYFKDDTGHDLIEARYNYWGTLCPSASRFYGAVSWIPWVDSTHTVVCTNCEDCSHSTEPSTWGAIKAMFR